MLLLEIITPISRLKRHTGKKFQLQYYVGAKMWLEWLFLWNCDPIKLKHFHTYLTTSRIFVLPRYLLSLTTKHSIFSLYFSLLSSLYSLTPSTFFLHSSLNFANLLFSHYFFSLLFHTILSLYFFTFSLHFIFYFLIIFFLKDYKRTWTYITL